MTAQPVISEEFRPNLSLQLAPPEQQIPEAPAHQAGSFLDTKRYPRAVELLTMTLDTSWSFSFAPEPAYERYLQMDKRLVDQSGVNELLDIYDEMRHQTMPRYLSVAGSAAAAAGLMATHFPKRKRLVLLENAVECWTQALVNSRRIEEGIGGELAEPSQPLRLALRIATAPLLESVIRGEVTKPVLRQVYEDCLDLAEHNEFLRTEAKRQGNALASSDYFGLSHEINVLLAVNGALSPTRFAVMSFTRSDAGHYLRGQTHDLSIIDQVWGRIRGVTPVEVKYKKKATDRRRYDALIIDNRDLTRGQLGTSEVLQAFVTAYHSPQKYQAVQAARIMMTQVEDLITSYCSSRELRPGETTSVTKFRDARNITSHHPGFVPKIVSSLRLLSQA